jgi:hypothetical protein
MNRGIEEVSFVLVDVFVIHRGGDIDAVAACAADKLNQDVSEETLQLRGVPLVVVLVGAVTEDPQLIPEFVHPRREDPLEPVLLFGDRL